MILTHIQFIFWMGNRDLAFHTRLIPKEGPSGFFRLFHVCLQVCPGSVSDDGCICAGLSHICALWGHSSDCPLCEGVMVQLDIRHLLKVSCNWGPGFCPSVLRKPVICNYVWSHLQALVARFSLSSGLCCCLLLFGSPCFFWRCLRKQNRRAERQRRKITETTVKM